MRSLLIILVAIIVLIGGFLVYYSLQSTDTGRAVTERRGPSTLPASVPPIPDDAAGPVAGPGSDVWVKSYDDRTGQVAFQFRASRYDPQPEGPVDVTNPQAELFTGDGEDRQVIRIEGKTGRVVMSAAAAQRGAQIRTGGGGAEASTPRRGELHDVTISLFDESDPDAPLLVCRVNNIAFDNDTFRIATEPYADAAGNDVPAEQVPVEVRGQDFDFDGRGLVIRWNEADRRLQLLEIAHGERLVIKSPEMLQALDRTTGPKEPRAPHTEERAQAESQIVLASAQEAAGPPDAAEDSKASEAEPASLPPVYRASFRDAVTITRAEQLLASADQMLVDFISDRAEPVSTPGRAKRRDSKRAEDAKVDREAPAGPTTAPAEPVVVRWSGKLRVTALEVDAPRPAPGSLNVAMSAEHRPVELHHRGLDVRCAAFDYRSGDDSLSVTSSKSIPAIELKLADGTTVHTPSIVYTGGDSKAVLRGESRAQIPLAPEAAAADEPAAQDQVLRARWSKSCVLMLTNTADAAAAQELRPERAVFEGEVQIDHPELALRSESLELGFHPTTNADQPAPSEIKAAGAVECRLIDASGNEQRIRCDELTALAAAPQDGKDDVTLKTFTADGNIVATSDEAEVRAGHLTVALSPAPMNRDDPDRPKDARRLWGGGDYQIDRITAQQDVTLAHRDGGSATAQQVEITLTAEGTVATLLGQPATLSDGTNTLGGPHITYAQGEQKLGVQGPGTLALVSRADDASDAPARPVQIAWDSSLAYDGLQNRAEISGNARIASGAPDGSQQLATGDKILIALVDAPAAPAPAAAAGNGAEATHPQRDDQPFDLGGDKVLRSVTLSGSAQVQSILRGDTEDQFRRIHLLAPQVVYDVEHARAEVPSAGRMLVQDTLPARDDEHPAAGNRMLGNFRGATAFRWDESLVFDQQANRMTMSGAVLIVHEDSSQPDQRFRMEAAQVTADLLDRDTDMQRDQDALFGPSELHLKTLTASGDIRLSLPRIQIDAQDVSYDAERELLTARGSDREPVQLYNPDGISRGSFQEIVWNARTEQIDHMREVQAQVRR